MRGRHPKPPEQRQRRNKTATAATLKAKPGQFAVKRISTVVAPPAARPSRKREARKAARTKPPRRRRARVQAPTQPARETTTKAPNLPKGYHWHPETTAWWRDSWASPMAAQWLASDVHVLRRLAVLVDEYWRRPAATLLAEIRQQEARFGLTPMDRHRLQWKIDTGASAGEEERDGDVDAPPPPDKDPRETLRLVK